MIRGQSQPTGLRLVGGLALVDAGIGFLLAIVEVVVAISSQAFPDVVNIATDVGVLCVGLSVAHAVLNERAWARELLFAIAIALFLLVAAAPTVGARPPVARLPLYFLTVAGVGAAFLTPLFWYLYRKPNVVAYFRDLKLSSFSHPADSLTH